jgi:hypothetical protein
VEVEAIALDSRHDGETPDLYISAELYGDGEVRTSQVFLS